MADVLPRVRPVAAGEVSAAELDVLGELAKLPADWKILHSLWLKTHAVKLDAQADFVVISDRAVLVLEVKGGQVWRDDDGWHFRWLSGGHEDVKPEGPLEQVRGAYYALRQHLRDLGRSSLFDDFVWGYGAILPGCVLQIGNRDSSLDQKMVLDRRGYPSEMAQFLDNLAEYWEGRIGGETHQTQRRNRALNPSISIQKRQEIVACLRPRLELALGVAAQVASSESAILRLTEQQLAALDYAAAEPRNLLIGSAGTGKTILAVEQAKRKAAEGRRVLFVCFNSLLARKVAFELRQDGGWNIHATNYHQLAMELVRKSGRGIEFSDDWIRFSQKLEESIVDLVSNFQDRERFDYLVVDESQDLMSEGFLDLLDCLLRGGLKEGSWLFAVDTQQTIFRNNFSVEMLERVSSLGRKVPLDINCRNTKQIAAYVRAMSGIGSVSTKSAEGEHPVVRYFVDRPEYLRLLKKLVNEMIASFTSLGMPAAGIAILAADKSYFPPEIRVPGFFLRPAKDIDPEDSDTDSIRIGTVQAFKGLESGAIVLVGFEHFEQSHYRDLFYVGASRAKAALRILLPVTCDQVQKALPEITRLLGTDAE